MSVDQARLPALHQRGLLPGRPGTEDLFWGKKKKKKTVVRGGSGDQRASMERRKDKKKRMSLRPPEACLWIGLISSVRQREANVTGI